MCTHWINKFSPSHCLEVEYLNIQSHFSQTVQTSAQKSPSTSLKLGISQGRVEKSFFLAENWSPPSLPTVWKIVFFFYIIMIIKRILLLMKFLVKIDIFMKLELQLPSYKNLSLGRIKGNLYSPMKNKKHGGL